MSKLRNSRLTACITYLPVCWCSFTCSTDCERHMNYRSVLITITNTYVCGVQKTSTISRELWLTFVEASSIFHEIFGVDQRPNSIVRSRRRPRVARFTDFMNESRVYEWSPLRRELEDHKKLFDRGREWQTQRGLGDFSLSRLLGDASTYHHWLTVRSSFETVVSIFCTRVCINHRLILWNSRYSVCIQLSSRSDRRAFRIGRYCEKMWLYVNEELLWCSHCLLDTACGLEMFLIRC